MQRYLSNRNRQLDPIHERHEHVGQQIVWRKAVRNLQRLLAAVSAHGIEAVTLEDFRNRISDELFIIYHQDFHWALLQSRRALFFPSRNSLAELRILPENMPGIMASMAIASRRE